MDASVYIGTDYTCYFNVLVGGRGVSYKLNNIRVGVVNTFFDDNT